MELKILKIQPETSSSFSAIFEKPNGFHFYPGQYLDYLLEVADPLGNTRAFTISASPTEDFLMLTTKKGKTVFKKALLNLKPGDEITISQPIGTFTLDESSPAVFIAGGIGITPFRSMIKYAVDNNLTTPMTLIYSNSDEEFIFKDELDEWQKLLPNLKITYHNSAKLGHLTTLNTSYLLPASPAQTQRGEPNAIYYLSGPPKFVDAMQKILLEAKIDETNIRSDYFDGYSSSD